MGWRLHSLEDNARNDIAGESILDFDIRRNSCPKVSIVLHNRPPESSSTLYLSCWNILKLLYRLSPTAVKYNIRICGFCDIKRMEAALELPRRRINDAILCDLDTCTTLTSGLIKGEGDHHKYRTAPSLGRKNVTLPASAFGPTLRCG